MVMFKFPTTEVHQFCAARNGACVVLIRSARLSTLVIVLAAAVAVDTSSACVAPRDAQQCVLPPGSPCRVTTEPRCPVETGSGVLAIQPRGGDARLKAGTVYFNSDSTLCWLWLAWASIAFEACARICDFASWVVDAE